MGGHILLSLVLSLGCHDFEYITNSCQFTYAAERRVEIALGKRHYQKDSLDSNDGPLELATNYYHNEALPARIKDYNSSIYGTSSREKEALSL